MYLILNSKNEIKGIGVTKDPSLKSVYVDENAGDFPFKGWPEAKICCYKVNVKDGIVTMMTPYIDSRFIEHFSQVGEATEDNEIGIAENSDGLFDMAEETSDIADALYELADYIAELEERITLLEESEE